MNVNGELCESFGVSVGVWVCDATMSVQYAWLLCMSDECHGREFSWKAENER